MHILRTVLQTTESGISGRTFDCYSKKSIIIVTR
jgi:hypothetical protein